MGRENLQVDYFDLLEFGVKEVKIIFFIFLKVSYFRKEEGILCWR